MTMFNFGPSRAEVSKQRKQERTRRRVELRRRRMEERKIKRQIAKQRKQRRKEELRWRKIERKRKVAQDKRVRKERKQMLREQKRRALGGGFWGQRRGGGSATARRAAHNLLQLANQIGVRFNADDQRELIEYADAQLAGSGDDIYTAYNRLVRMTYIGRRIRGVVGQYDVEDVESGADAGPQPDDDTAAAERLLSRITGAAELLGQWERTNSVEKATAQGVMITQVLGATPEEIKRDQEQIRQTAEEQTYNHLLTANVKFDGKRSWLWMLLNPQANPNQAAEMVEADIRNTDAAEAEREAEAVAAEDRADIQQLSPLERAAYYVGRVRAALTGG